MKRITVDDAGVYWCRASNVLGSTTGAVATVTGIVIRSLSQSSRFKDTSIKTNAIILNISYSLTENYGPINLVSLSLCGMLQVSAIS
jgi:hypothetical protein